MTAEKAVLLKELDEAVTTVLRNRARERSSILRDNYVTEEEFLETSARCVIDAVWSILDKFNLVDSLKEGK